MEFNREDDVGCARWGRSVWAGILLAGLLEQETGQIDGVAVDDDGQPLAHHTVQAKRVTGNSSGARAELVVGTTTTDAEGRFSFTGLEPNNYRVEVISDDEVIAVASLTLAPGAMQVSSVTFTATDSGGLSRGQWIAIIGIGAGLGFVITAFAIQSYVAGRSSVLGRGPDVPVGPKQKRSRFDVETPEPAARRAPRRRSPPT